MKARLRGPARWLPVARWLDRAPDATPVTVICTVGPGQVGLVADCLASIPDHTRALVCGWGGAEPQCRAHDELLLGSESANQARNAALERVSGAVLLIEAHERLTDRGVAALADASRSWEGEGSWVRRGPASRLSSYLWGPGACSPFQLAHGRFPQASLPVETPTDAAAEAGGFVEPVASPGAAWGVGFGTTPAVAGELGAYVAVLDQGTGSQASWLAGFLADTLPVFLDDLEHAADPAPLGSRLAALTDSDFGRAALAGLPAEQRSRAWLAAQGRFEELFGLTAARWYAEGHAPTEVAAGRILHELGVSGLPDEARTIPVTAEAFLARAWREGHDGLRFLIYTALRWVDFDTYAPQIEAEWVEAAGARVPARVSATPDPNASRHFRQAHQSHDAGAVLVSVDAALPPGRWHLELSVAAGGVRATCRVAGREARGSAGILGQLATVSAAPAWEPDQGLCLESPSTPAAPAAGAAPTVVAAEVGTDSELSLELLGQTPTRLSLRAGAWCLPAEPGDPTEPALDPSRARFRLAHDPWGAGPRPVPAGTWHLAWAAGRQAGEAAIGVGLAEQTPREVLTEHHRLRITRGLRDQFLVSTAAPLGPDELGPLRQQRLRSAYLNAGQSTGVPVEENLVLFTSYAGTAATDSPRAIYDELRARETGHRLLWAVADHSVPVPPGAEVVLRHSAAWYDALARAATIVTNIEMERWFRRRPGQRLVQTFHGYPSKSMGKMLWRAKNMSPARIEQMLVQTSRQWSLALTPAPEMDRHYREQYDYAGEILNQGYPRDDVLVGTVEELAERRAAARARLGIDPDRVVVLYAPTWRDDQATNFRSAAWVNYLDVDEAVAALGESHLFLVRGHRFQKPPVGATKRALLDVTSYPEINDLILASDAAVVDYSSIRFDLALAGVPQIFLVPDLDSYAGDGRGFLYPFLDSAPGPLVDNTGAVVAHLRNLPGLRERYREQSGAFAARFLAEQDGRAASRVVDWMLD